MAEDEPSEWVGQVFALLLVGGLIGLVVWFAMGREAGAGLGSDAEVADGATEDAALDDDGGADGGEEEGASAEASAHSGLDTAIFGAVFESGSPTFTGCVLAVSLAAGPSIRQVQLFCDETTYASDVYESPTGEVREASSPDGPVYGIAYRSPDTSAPRLAVDTSNGSLLWLDGSDMARFRIDAFSAPRPSEPFDASASPAPEREAEGGECFVLGSDWVGEVLAADETLAPLRLRPLLGDGFRLELFDPRADTIQDGIRVDCDAGTIVMEGESDHYEGRFGPGNETIVGKANVGGEPGLFWLRRDRGEGSSVETAP